MCFLATRLCDLSVFLRSHTFSQKHPNFQVVGGPKCCLKYSILGANPILGEAKWHQKTADFCSKWVMWNGQKPKTNSIPYKNSDCYDLARSLRLDQHTCTFKEPSKNHSKKRAVAWPPWCAPYCYKRGFGPPARKWGKKRQKLLVLASTRSSEMISENLEMVQNREKAKSCVLVIVL